MALDVPHILRVLAADFYRDRGDKKHVTFDRSLALFLDARPAIYSQIKFDLSWWLAKRDPYTDEVLGPQTIDMCLQHFEKEINRMSAAPQEEHVIASYAQYQLGMSYAEYMREKQPAVLADARGIENKSPDEQARVLDALNDIDFPCTSCKTFWGSAVNAFTHNLEHVQYLKTNLNAVNTQKSAAARRAAGFMKLYEEVVSKETSGKFPMPVPTTPLPRPRPFRTRKAELLGRKQRKMASTTAFAQEELERIRGMPALKWTAGEELSLTDIVAIADTRPYGMRTEHSDYREQLPDDTESGSYSEGDSAPTQSRTWIVDALTTSDQRAPSIADSDGQSMAPVEADAAAGVTISDLPQDGAQTPAVHTVDQVR